MLSNSEADVKIIVLMSDGLPNNGKTGESLIRYADELKARGILIYTLGFFSSVDYSDLSSAQYLMEGIASEGCHYEVDDASQLVYFFGDIADQINGQKYIYIRIACPVDVEVSHNGETLCSSYDGLSTRTSFGTLTFEEEEYSGYYSDNRIKVLRLKEGVDYDVRINGTGEGTMDYTIRFADEYGQYSDTREFMDIEITEETVIRTVAAPAKSTRLEIDSNGDGRTDKVYEAEANGTGAEVKIRSKKTSTQSRGFLAEHAWILFAGGGLLLAAAIVLALAAARRKKTLAAGPGGGSSVAAPVVPVGTAAGRTTAVRTAAPAREADSDAAPVLMGTLAKKKTAPETPAVPAEPRAEAAAVLSGDVPAFCKFCGARLVEGTRYCPQCGKDQTVVPRR